MMGIWMAELWLVVDGLFSCALQEGEAVRSLICDFWEESNGVIWVHNDLVILSMI